MKTLSCKHMGERDVSRHISLAQHQRRARGVKNVAPLSFAREDTSARHKVRQ